MLQEKTIPCKAVCAMQKKAGYGAAIARPPGALLALLGLQTTHQEAAALPGLPPSPWSSPASGIGEGRSVKLEAQQAGSHLPLAQASWLKLV